MSYIRFGADCDIYLIGTYRKGVKVAECCGCRLNTQTRDMTPAELEKIHPALVPGDGKVTFRRRVHADPAYATKVGMCGHLDEHRDAGHQVPEEAYDSILADSEWLEE